MRIPLDVRMRKRYFQSRHVATLSALFTLHPHQHPPYGILSSGILDGLDISNDDIVNDLDISNDDIMFTRC